MGSSSYTQKPTTVEYRAVSYSHWALCISFLFLLKVPQHRKPRQACSKYFDPWCCRNANKAPAMWCDKFTVSITRTAIRSEIKQDLWIETMQFNLPFVWVSTAQRLVHGIMRLSFWLQKIKNKKPCAKHKTHVQWFTFGWMFCWLGSSND